VPCIRVIVWSRSKPSAPAENQRMTRRRVILIFILWLSCFKVTCIWKYLIYISFYGLLMKSVSTDFLSYIMSYIFLFVSCRRGTVRIVPFPPIIASVRFICRDDVFFSVVYNTIFVPYQSLRLLINAAVTGTYPVCIQVLFYHKLTNRPWITKLQIYKDRAERKKKQRNVIKLHTHSR
jgi:hypothetical protein